MWEPRAGVDWAPRRRPLIHAPGIAILLSTAILALLLAFLFASRGAGAGTEGVGTRNWDEAIESFIRRKVAETYVDELDEARAADAFERAMDAYVDFDAYCDYIPPRSTSSGSPTRPAATRAWA